MIRIPKISKLSLLIILVAAVTLGASNSAFSIDIEKLEGFYVADIKNPDVSNMSIFVDGEDVVLEEIEADGTLLIFIGKFKEAGFFLYQDISNQMETGSMNIKHQIRFIVDVDDSVLTINFILSETFTVTRKVFRSGLTSM